MLSKEHSEQNFWSRYYVGACTHRPLIWFEGTYTIITTSATTCAYITGNTNIIWQRPYHSLACIGVGSLWVRILGENSTKVESGSIIEISS